MSGSLYEQTLYLNTGKTMIKFIYSCIPSGKNKYPYWLTKMRNVSPIKNMMTETNTCLGLVNPGPVEIRFLMMIKSLIAPNANNAHPIILKAAMISIPGFLIKYPIYSPLRMRIPNKQC